jgi:3-methyladenine DNA glycosylase AlkD
MMEMSEVMERLKSASNPESLPGMKRFGINVNHAYGVSIPTLRKLASESGKNHNLAQRLWQTRVHEARILATMIDDAEKVGASQMDKWAHDFDSWDLCDQCCSNLFDKTRFAYKKAFAWSHRKEEFVKRAGFALMASLAVHDKEARDEPFRKFLECIVRESSDNRNFVRKSVNWALRQIGKRNRQLNRLAIGKAKEIHRLDSKSAKWIANDALRELTSPSVTRRLRG